MPAELTTRIFDRARRMALLDALPSLSGLSSERVDAIRGGAGYTASEYERLCRALAVDPVILYRGDENDPRRSPARFRAAISLDAPSGHDLRTLALAGEIGAILAGLSARLGRGIPLAAQRAVKAIDAHDEGRQGYELGQAARAVLAAEPAPIKSVLGLLRRWGVHVAWVPFSSGDIDAASIWAPDAVPVILVNSRSARAGHPGALRATLAHELCHLLHDAGEQDLTTMVSWGAGERGNYAESVEIRARAFAPAFIAPPPAVTAWAGAARFADDHSLVQALATTWGLSFEGAAWHATNCHLIERTVAEQLAHLRPKPPIVYPHDESGSEPRPHLKQSELSELPELIGPVSPLWAGFALELVHAALDEGHISPGRARELLTWS